MVLPRVFTVVSLFAGVGGFDLGAERSGFSVIGQVEIDKRCQEVLRKQFPNALLHDDITTAAQWAKENDLIGKVDIVCGGFPCQDVSVAGKRAGIAGARSGLFWDAIRFAQEVKAHTIILENVPGLLSSNDGCDFGVVVSEMANAGYRHIEWRVLDSQFFGVAQRRRRVFIVGSTRDFSRSPVLIERESLRGNPAQSREKRESPAGDSAQCFGQSSFAGYTEGVATLTATNYKRPEDNVVFTKSRRAQSVDDYETWVTDQPMPTLNSFDGGDTRATAVIVRMREGKEGGGKGALISDNISLTLATGNDQVVFYGNRVADVRIQDDKVNTLQARMGTGGNNMPMIAAEGVRRLTPVECEKLQGFPDDWTQGQSDSARYKQMGNAVTVNVAEWVFQQLHRALLCLAK